MSVIVHTPVAPTSAPQYRNIDLAASHWIPPPISTPIKLDIFSSSEKNRVNIPAEQPDPPQPYFHPFLRQSPGLIMSQTRLDICTENLGSETGSDWFFSPTEPDHCISSLKTISFFYIHGVKEKECTDEEAVEVKDMQGRKKLTSVNYHRSTGGRFPTQSFPPPLPSISRRDGACIQMRSHRRDGRLIVEAVGVPSHNYLHAERHGGRLRLSFVESLSNMHAEEVAGEKDREMEEDFLMVEEEVEVRMKNKGTVVEFNVSMRPPPVITGAPKAKVRRSSLVINKFLVGPPQLTATFDPPFASRAANPGCSISVSTWDALSQPPWGPQLTREAMEWKLLFTSKRRSREELLSDVQRCSDFGWPLFIFEQPCCIATTT